MERWIGKVALVTGASTGIGAELCRALVQYGMKVVGCGPRLDEMEDIANENAVKISPGTLEPIRCDVSKESEILSMFDEIRNKFDRLDVCINNAGLGHDSPLLSGSTADFRNMLDVNVLAPCICTKEAVKLMREKEIKDGQIIHISSYEAHQLLPTDVSMMGIHFYCGTKSMIRTLTECHRRELKALKSRIRIASVSPGLVKTEFLDKYLKNSTTLKASDIYEAMQALTTKDISDSVIYILSTPQHVEVHDILLRPYDQHA